MCLRVLIKIANSPIPSSNFAFNSNLKLYNYDPGTAADILRSKAIVLTLSVIDRPENIAVANEIKNYWEMAGVKVTIKAVPVEQVARCN